MPQGKGTYGSKVGRPPKKYQVGGKIKPPTAPSISQYEKGGKVDPKDVSRRVGSSLSKGAKKGYKRPTYTPYEGSKTPIQDMRDFNKMQDIKERRMKDKKK
mgnify:CR=1 FL=1